MAINRNKVLAAAQKHVRKGSWDKALKEYRALVDDDSSDVRSLLKCGDLYVKMGRTTDALNSYKSVADHYAQQDMYEKAVAVYKQALRLDPEEVKLHQALGEAYHRLGRLKDAVRSFHQAQGLYKQRGDAVAQREVLEYMVRIDSEDIGLRIQLAERYAKDNLTQKSVDIFLSCAELLEGEGRLDEFVQVAERIIFLDPEQYDLRKRIVRIYLDRQDNKQALQHLQLCFKALPGDIEILELLGQTFERLHRGEKAVLVYLELVQLYEKQGRKNLIKDLYRRILRIDPANHQAKRALGQVRVTSVDDSDVYADPVDTDSLRTSNNVPPGPNTADALDGIEFLDEVEFLDVESEVKPVPVASARRPEPSKEAYPSVPMPVQPPGPMLSESEIVDLSDELVFLDDHSPALVEETHQVRYEAPEVDVEPIDGELTETEVAQLLTECQVFLKYGLYDKAHKVIGSALAQAPNSIYAHEQMLALCEATGDQDGIIRELLELGRVTSDIPARAYTYLARALDVSPNPARVHAYAGELGIDLNEPMPIQEGLDEISMGAIEAIESIKPVKSDEEIDEELDDGLGLFLADESSVVEFVSETSEPDEIAIDELPFADDDFDALEDLDELEALGALPAMDSAVVSDEELLFGDDDVFDDLEPITDADIVELEAALPDPDAPSVDSLLSDVDADDMFDDLFADVFDDIDINLGGDDPEGDLAEVDFFIQQGLTEEASEALLAFEEDNPKHVGIDKRRAQLETVRSGIQVSDNPFGARSLSQKFNPQAVMEQKAPSGPIPNFFNTVNSNLELGASYRDMGLFEEAIEEFRQALDDPEASLTARYHIALCEFELGNESEARDSLKVLLKDGDLTIEIRQIVESKLRQIA
ncbi:MAG: tetratricopeptide repeat protein [Bradymonadaceae bacterium]